MATGDAPTGKSNQEPLAEILPVKRGLHLLWYLPGGSDKLCRYLVKL